MATKKLTNWLNLDWEAGMVKYLARKKVEIEQGDGAHLLVTILTAAATIGDELQLLVNS